MDAAAPPSKANDPPRRERYNAFLVRHEVAWELGMAFLAIVFVALGFLIDEAPVGTRPALECLEIGLTLLFIAEFVTRIAAAHDRWQYLRGHFIDLVALAPPVRELRVLRLLRLLRLVRAFAGVYRAATHLEGIARHRALAWLVVSWLSVMVLCSIALYAAEHGINKAIESPFDALWWGVVTLSTVGYGDVYPITTSSGSSSMCVVGRSRLWSVERRGRPRSARNGRGSRSPGSVTSRQTTSGCSTGVTATYAGTSTIASVLPPTSTRSSPRSRQTRRASSGVRTATISLHEQFVLSCRSRLL
jgi:voltage-gated potassium channel Kch